MLPMKKYSRDNPLWALQLVVNIAVMPSISITCCIQPVEFFIVLSIFCCQSLCLDGIIKNAVKHHRFKLIYWLSIRQLICEMAVYDVN